MDSAFSDSHILCKGSWRLSRCHHSVWCIGRRCPWDHRCSRRCQISRSSRRAAAHSDSPVYQPSSSTGPPELPWHWMPSRSHTVPGSLPKTVEILDKNNRREIMLQYGIIMTCRREKSIIPQMQVFIKALAPLSVSLGVLFLHALSCNNWLLIRIVHIRDTVVSYQSCSVLATISGSKAEWMAASTILKYSEHRVLYRHQTIYSDKGDYCHLFAQHYSLCLLIGSV